jgi:hypothetical protein
LIEAAGIIISARLKIEKALQERKAFDHKSATDAKEAKIDIQPLLDLLERRGLIGRTAEGRIFMTKKGQDVQIRGFLIIEN